MNNESNMPKDSLGGGEPTMDDILVSIRRFLKEDSPQAVPRGSSRVLDEDEINSALGFKGDAGDDGGESMAAEWEAMLGSGTSMDAIIASARRVLNEDEINSLRGFDDNAEVPPVSEGDKAPRASGQSHSSKGTADLYLVDINFHCNGVCNKGALRAMEEIIGREFFEGRLRMNANQLVRLLLVQREQLNPIRQYEITGVQRDDSGLIDVSES